jgi:hypothetical protein
MEGSAMRRRAFNYSTLRLFNSSSIQLFIYSTLQLFIYSTLPLFVDALVLREASHGEEDESVGEV